MDQGEEDDDFGDFGGFETADPILPNVTQVQPSGIEASPSPWAVFAAGSSPGNAKPDLLCDQNRFPPLLDPSVPSTSADTVQNGDTNNSNEGIPTVDHDGTSENQNENYDDAIMANDILDGSFKSTSSQHSGSTAADIIRSVNSEVNGSTGAPNVRKNSQSVDLVGDLLGASPGIILVEDENLQVNSLDIGETNSVLIPKQKSSVEQSPVPSPSSKSAVPIRETEVDLTNSLQTATSTTSSGSSHSSESHHMNSPILIDSLRKALQQKPAAVDVVKLSQKKVDCSPREEQKVSQIEIDPVICEEIRQARIESQAAIATVVNQYKELSKQCVLQQEDILKECKQIFKQEQEVQIQQLLQQQKEEFSKALEEEKIKLKQESAEMMQELVSEQKKDFDLQMEIEKEKYEKRLQETLEVILIMIYNWNYCGSCLNVTHQGTRDCTGCRNTQAFFS